MNKTILVGHLGRDPEIVVTKNGEKMATLSLATTERWTDKKTGEKSSHTEWHRVVLFGHLAQTAESYLKKGSHVYIEGPLQTRKWQDKENKDRYTTEINGRHMELLGPAPSPTETATASANNNVGAHNPDDAAVTDDDLRDMDIPF